MFGAIILLTTLGLGLGVVLGFATLYLKVEGDPLTEEIEGMMPGSQCGQCGFPGCRPAAEALVKGEAPVDLCPPGGRDLAESLADKLGIEADLSDIEHPTPLTAHIRPEACIGCTRCFKACPTDAIIGAPKQIHMVFTDACTGCGNCTEVCPTECLVLEPEETSLDNWRWPKPPLAA